MRGTFVCLEFETRTTVFRESSEPCKTEDVVDCVEDPHGAVGDYCRSGSFYVEIVSIHFASIFLVDNFLFVCYFKVLYDL